MKPKIFKIERVLDAKKENSYQTITEYEVTKETERMFFLQSDKHRTRQLKTVLEEVHLKCPTPNHIRIETWCWDTDLRKVKGEVTKLLKITVEDMKTKVLKLSSQLK